MSTATQRPPMDLQSFLLDVYFRYRPTARSEQTRMTYSNQLKTFSKFLASRETDSTTYAFTEDIGVDFAKWYTDDLGLSPFTANSILGVVRAVWGEAYKRGYCPEPPCVHKLPLPDRMPEAWYENEFEAILAEAAKTKGVIGAVPACVWWPSLILTVFWTGARLSAAMGIRSDAVDLERGTVVLPHQDQKTYRDEIRDISPELCALLTQFDKDRLELLFGDWPYDNKENRKSKRGWTTLNRRYTRILERAGVKSGRRDKWHKIRRTFGTRIADRTNKAVAQELLGHRDPKPTEGYLDPRQMRRHQATKIISAPRMPHELIAATLASIDVDEMGRKRDKRMGRQRGAIVPTIESQREALRGKGTARNPTVLKYFEDHYRPRDGELTDETRRCYLTYLSRFNCFCLESGVSPTVNGLARGFGERFTEWWIEKRNNGWAAERVVTFINGLWLQAYEDGLASIPPDNVADVEKACVRDHELPSLLKTLDRYGPTLERPLKGLRWIDYQTQFILMLRYTHRPVKEVVHMSPDQIDVKRRTVTFGDDAFPLCDEFWDITKRASYRNVSGVFNHASVPSRKTMGRVFKRAGVEREGNFRWRMFRLPLCHPNCPVDGKGVVKSCQSQTIT